MDEACPTPALRAHAFMTTRWALVDACKQSDQVVAKQALGELCQSYWYPIYAVIRHSGYQPADAQDLTQEFFLRMLKNRWIERLDQSKGRFRAYILTALKHFVRTDHRRRWTFRRGRGHVLVSIDVAQAETMYSLELTTVVTPETLYEQKWAATVIANALEQLRLETSTGNRPALFACFKQVIFAETDASFYRATADRMGMQIGALQTAVSRLRRRMAILLRAEIARTLAQSTESEIDLELRHLLAVASGSGQYSL